MFASDKRTIASVIHLVLLHHCKCITYSRQENTIDSGACSRVSFNQCKWGTQNNPAGAPYQVPYIASPIHHVLHACFSRGPVAGNHYQNFLDLVGSNTIAIVHRIEKKNVWTIAIMFDPIGSKTSWRDFLQLGPCRSEKQPSKNLGDRSVPFGVEEGKLSTFSGQTLSCEPTGRYIPNGLQQIW